MKTTIAACALVLLAACASTRPTVAEGNQSTVVVDWAQSSRGSDGALAVADAHCAQYGKHARYSGKPNSFRIAYDCVR